MEYAVAYGLFSEAGKLASPKGFDDATPMEKDEWPHRTRLVTKKRHLLGRILTGKKTVQRWEAYPAEKTSSLAGKAYVNVYPVGTRKSRKSTLERHKELKAQDKPAKKDGIGRAARDAAVLGAGFTAGYGAGGLAHYGMRKSKLKAGDKFRAMTPQQLKNLRRVTGLAGLGVGAATLATRYARHRLRDKEQRK